MPGQQLVNYFVFFEGFFKNFLFKKFWNFRGNVESNRKHGTDTFHRRITFWTKTRRAPSTTIVSECGKHVASGANTRGDDRSAETCLHKTRQAKFHQTSTVIINNLRYTNNNKNFPATKPKYRSASFPRAEHFVEWSVDKKQKLRIAHNRLPARFSIQMYPSN